MISATEAADHVDIAQCLQRYGQALDDRAWDVFDTVFTPDATLRYDIEGSLTSLRMAELKESSRKLFERFWWTQHMFSIPLIELAGSEARATCRLIATHVQRKLDGTSSRWVLYGTYRDALVRGVSGWRIRERHLHGVYSEGVLLPRKLVKTFTSAPTSG
jgi:hypothetical protein